MTSKTMTSKAFRIGAALLLTTLLFLVVSVPAFALPLNGQTHSSPATPWLLGLLAIGALAGTVTLTYNTMPDPRYPTLGGTVAPTTAQNATYCMESVTANYADADTSIALVHNWGLSTAQTAVFPILTITLVGSGGTVLPIFTVGPTGSAANTLTVTKVNAAGSAGTATFLLNRPSTAVE